MKKFRIFRRTSRFKRSWKKYVAKYAELKKQAESALRKFAENPDIPGLRVKKIRGTENLWELSVNLVLLLVVYNVA